jgi:glycosyltransferase involved in cell wall biosynthesis/LmbE family N-acetylglucosaminyl deacetylase/SAM-dependent methyltransferase
VGGQVHTFGQALVAKGHSVVVLALEEPGEPDFQEDGGIQVHRVQRGNLHWYISRIPLLGGWVSLALRELEYAWAAWRQVRRLHAEAPFDLIEATETGALFTALWAKAPLVIRLHGEEYTFRKYTPDLRLTLQVRLSRVLQRAAMRRAQILISPGVAHAREVAVELGGHHPPIDILPNAIPSGLETRKLGDSGRSAGSEPMVLYVGRLERGKGIPVLLEAARRILDEMPEVRFVLAGAPHPTLPKAELKELVDRHGLNGQLRCLGHVPHEELVGWYRSASVCVLPSYYETFGVAALEAIVCGVPVIASNVGGLTEVVDDGVTGILTPPGDSKALARAIVHLLRDDEMRAGLAMGASRRVAARFAVGRLVPLALDLYNWAIRARHSEPNGAGCEHVFFSPHADDVVLSCGGAISLLLARGAAVSVITVFGGDPKGSRISAFARHLSRKWRLADHVSKQRRKEDEEALRLLGVEDMEQWDLPEAPYREALDGGPLYSTYTELKGRPTPEDAVTEDELRRRVENWLHGRKPDAVLYFPLSLGGHVDHRILFHAGVWLRAKGYNVRFYEEWPYAESYLRTSLTPGWARRSTAVPLKRKIDAAQRYYSQIPGLGGSPKRLSQRLRKSTRGKRRSGPQEVCWELLPGTAARLPADPSTLELPLETAAKKPSMRDFGAFAAGFRLYDLGEILPVGQGYCLDLGCGGGRHRATIRSHGYDWIGMETSPQASAPDLVGGDIRNLPFKRGSAAAVVAWQVLEYVEAPEQAVQEASRVLEPGGVFCGSVSFLEPLHGKTFCGMSHLFLEQLLARHGFADIEVRAGLSGFALMTWTWLRRWGGPAWGRLAIPMSAALLIPPATLRFLASYLWLRLGLGDGHGMRWIAERAPLEFAGHLMFVARLRARR